jgi:hypothetical protein
MASYDVAEDDIAKHDFVMVASTVDTVTFFDKPSYVMIVTDGTSKIYFTTDGTTPTVSGPKTYIMPATPCTRTMDHGDGPVKMISSGTPTVSVERA